MQKYTIAYYSELNGTSGTITPPTGATIVLNPTPQEEQMRSFQPLTGVNRYIPASGVSLWMLRVSMGLAILSCLGL